MDLSAPSADTRRTTAWWYRTAVCCSIFVAAGLAGCGGGSASDDAPGNKVPVQAGQTPGSGAAPNGWAAPAGDGTGQGNDGCSATPSVQVQLECGFSFDPCGDQGVLRLTQGADGMPFQDGAERYLLKYENDAVVMTTLLPHAVPGALPHGLDIYRGDIPIVKRESPRCEPGGTGNPPSCTPDTALAFVAWYDFPTDPATPRIIPIPPPRDWGKPGHAGPSATYHRPAPGAQDTPGGL